MDKELNVIKLYYITTCGRVFSNMKGRDRSKYYEVKVRYDKDGYKDLTLIYDYDDKGISMRQPFKIHRLVALKYLEECPYEKRIVNHKNAVKQDNYIQNLEWSTVSHNTQHGFDMSCYDNINQIEVTNTVNNEIKIYPSSSHVARELDIPRGSITYIIDNGCFVNTKKYKKYEHLRFRRI